MLGCKIAMFSSSKNSSVGARFAGRAAKALAVAVLLMLPAGAANAADAKDAVSLQFDVYSGSLRLFKISMGMEMGDADYAINTRIKSKGLATLFAKTKIHMSAQGRKKKKLVPLKYASKSDSKGRKRALQMTWSNKGKHEIKRSYKLSAYKANALSRAVKPGMMDPLSYLMSMVQASKKPCGGTQRVFDGREVAEYRYSLKGVSNFNRSTGGVYRGKAFKCVLNYRSVAGLSAKKQKAHNQGPPTVFTIWFAPVAGKKRNFFVPVAANGRVAGREITMRLMEGSVSGTPISKRVVATN